MLSLGLGFTCAVAADRTEVLNVYAWAEYFPSALIDKFQSETGIHVNYAVLDSPETAETILSVGHSNYDLVTMNASPELAREIPKGFWKKLDWTSLPNARNADPQIMQLLQSVDPGNQYAVPWMWGTTGLIYNTGKIKAIMPNAPLDSLDMVLKKDVAAKFAGCGISPNRLLVHAGNGALLHRQHGDSGRLAQFSRRSRLHQLRHAARNLGLGHALDRLCHRECRGSTAARACDPQQCAYLSAAGEAQSF